MGKNVTFTFNDVMEKQIEELIEYYQKLSISTVNKTDLIRHLLELHHKEIFGESENGEVKLKD